MRFYQQTWSLAGLLLLLQLPLSQGEANMAIWDIDDSCSHYPYGGKTGGADERPYLQAGFNDALEASKAALDSLKFILQKQPDKEKDPIGFIKWNRIADSLAATAGFYPTPDTTRSTTDEYWSDVIALFEKAVTTLPASKNNPPKGYNEKLTAAVNGQPQIVCGEETFNWIGINDIPPGSDKRMRDDPEFTPWLVNGYVGAWEKRHSLVFAQEDEKPIYCRNPTIAVVTFKQNLVMFCEGAFTASMKAKPTLGQVKTGDMIKPRDFIHKHVNRFGYYTLHEMMHWFGGLKKNPNGSFTPNTAIIVDQQAVDENGDLVYVEPRTGQHFSSPKKKKNWPAPKAYGCHYIFNLAKKHPGSSLEAYSGPGVATKNADSLAMFAIMMYLDKWDWSKGCLARTPGQIDS